MKRSVAIILIVVISVAAIALAAGIGKGAMTLIDNIGDIFGGTEENTEDASGAQIPDLPHESDTGLKFTETEPIETEPLLPPLNSERLDFEDLELTILMPDTFSYRREWGQKATEDEIDEALVIRNNDILTELGISLQYKFAPDDSAEYFDLAFGDLTNATEQYDIVTNGSAVMSRLAVRGALSDLHDTEQFPYLDFTNVNWISSVNTNLALGGKLYFTTGFFSITMLDNISVMFVNGNAYDKNRTDDDPESVQIYALEGNWTYENMYKIINAFSASMPNDDILVIDRDMGNNDILRSFAAAFDADVMGRLNSGWEYSLVSNPIAEDVLTRTRELYSVDGVNQNESTEKFVAGENLFLMTKMYKDYESNMAIREMDDKFGLMPLPKYDTAQEQYKAVSADSSFIGILDHSAIEGETHGIALSAFLQMLAERSGIGAYAPKKSGTLGYYFNRVLKPKFFGVDDAISTMTITKSIEIFDVLMYNIEFEFCNVYSSELGGIGDIWGDAYSNNKTLEQAYNARKEEYRQALDELNSRIGQK